MKTNTITTILLCALVAALWLGGCQRIETANRSEAPNSSAASAATTAKVASVLAANDITVPDVATFLFARGWTIIPANLDKPHWRPVNWAPGDRPAYYLARICVAVGDTTFQAHLPQAIGPYCVEVMAYRGDGTHSDWSLVGYSDNGTGSNALPGVRP